MAILNLNNQKIQINEERFLNLRTLLPQLQRKFPLADYHFENFEVNGRKLDWNSEEYEMVRPIHCDDYISIDINAKRESEIQLLKEVVGLTNKILAHIDCSVAALKEDLIIEAKEKLVDIINAMETFILTSSYFCKEVEESELLPYKELQIHLLSIMKAISDANLKQDTIMLTDLLEYELKDNLTQWKIHIFTSLKFR